MDVGRQRSHPADWAAAWRATWIGGSVPAAARLRAADVLRRSPGLVPTAAALAAAVVWGAHDGGLEPLDWPVAALALVAVAAVVLLAAGVPRPRGRCVVLALASFAAFAAVSEASVAWAVDRGAAWEGANKTLVYAVAFAAAGWVGWGARSALGALAGFAVAVVGLGTAALAAAATGAGWRDAFVAGRFAAPMGYENADAALFLMAVWPLLAVALRRRGPVLVRGGAIGGVAVLIELALLVQSRASVVALPLVLCVFAALAPRRLHLLLVVAIVGGATALAAPRLLAVYPAVNAAADVPETVRRALWAVVATGAGAACAGVALALLDRRLAVPPRTARRVGAAVTAAGLLALGTGAALVVHRAAPAARTGWHQFTHDAAPASGSTHLSAGLGSNRYDFWRVAWDTFLAHPILGSGADNFAAQYARERRSSEEPRFPHSLELRVLSQTGAIGALLLALGLLLPLAAVPRRGLGQDARLARAAALALTGYWLVHGSVDWLWEFPALSVPALVALGLAARVGRSEPAAPLRRAGRGRLTAAILVASTIAVVGSLALPWLSAEATAVADRTWSTDPRTAFAALHLAARLDPVSDQPYLTEAVIRSRLSDWQGMAAASQAALARRPDDWYAAFELAVADVRLRRLPAARAALDRARALNPREPALELVAAGIAHPASFDPAEVDGVFLTRAAAVAAP